MKALRIAVLGRTEMLFEAARRALSRGHELAVVATCKASGHEQATERDFEDLARSAGAAFFRHRELTSPAGLDIVERSACDLALSMNWLTILPSHVRSLFGHGVFNAHPGDLPRYRGNACPNWAILNGESEVGLCIHRMDDELDCGHVAVRRYMPLRPASSIGDVYDWLRVAVPDAFAELVDAVAGGNLKLTPQSIRPEDALRCYPRRPEDGRIDWRQPVDLIDRLVRASGHPFAGAFCFLEGQRKVTVWSAARVPCREAFLAIPGQVAYAIDGDPVIAGNGGFLRLADLEVDGCHGAESGKAAVLSSLRNRLV